MLASELGPWSNLRQLVAWIHTRDAKLWKAEDESPPPPPLDPRYALQEVEQSDGSIEIEAVQIGGDDLANGYNASASTKSLNPLLRWARAYEDGGTPERAEYDAITALQKGTLTCWGRREGEGQRVAIPAVEWADLRFGTTPWGVVAVAMGGNPPRPLDGATMWWDLLFLTQEVLRMWPAREGQSLGCSAGGEGVASPSESPPPHLCKTDREKAARRYFDGMRKRGEQATEKEIVEGLKSIPRFGHLTRDRARELITKYGDGCKRPRGRPPEKSAKKSAKK